MTDIHNPPFDGSDPCPACPVEVRNLAACAHNAVGAFRAASEGSGDWSRAYRKLAELERAVELFKPISDAHFADTMHSHGTVS